ncbi:MAG TPA: flagellar basal body-associated FliL family protein [Clostridiales bacterium]|nr:flagellar basal body-associated FliL family protein [Clostridiales bacterium]HOQ06586.1 flagellar basal body-associated FliL family protein [Clostridiales bacterium]HPP35664.1 flagellar basal body-associated FliL family protein [Clostridiales bacterium]HPV01526.1 flagellar basal body-associated FliL family protein [Clostridiales bacterium]
MESKSTFFILIVIVAVLALSLAALAGYLLIVQGSPGDSGDGRQDGSEEDTVVVPKEEELLKIPLYDGAKYFTLKKEKANDSSIIQVNVTLKCYRTLKSNKKVVVEELINAKKEEIQELVVRFFMSRTVNEIRDVDMLDSAKLELAGQINSLLSEGLEKPEDVVYRVIFSEWLFQ